MSKEYIDEEAVKRIEKIVQQESIDNANPSEALEHFINYCENHTTGYTNDTDREDMEYVQQALLKAEKNRKDLEEQIGCPLDIVIKALKNGIYTLDLPREDLTKQVGLKLSNRENEWYLSNDIMCVNLKDYKTSFWLEKDKSE